MRKGCREMRVSCWGRFSPIAAASQFLPFLRGGNLAETNQSSFPDSQHLLDNFPYDKAHESKRLKSKSRKTRLASSGRREKKVTDESLHCRGASKGLGVRWAESNKVAEAH